MALIMILFLINALGVHAPNLNQRRNVKEGQVVVAKNIVMMNRTEHWVHAQCRRRSQLCPPLRSPLCAARITDGALEYRNFENDCILTLENICDYPGQEFHIVRISNCTSYLSRRDDDSDTKTITKKTAAPTTTAVTMTTTEENAVTKSATKKTAVTTIATDETAVTMTTTEETAVSMTTAEETAVSMTTAEETAVSMTTAEETAVTKSTTKNTAVTTISTDETTVTMTTTEQTAVTKPFTIKTAATKISTEETADTMTTTEETAVTKSATKKTAVTTISTDETAVTMTTTENTDAQNTTVDNTTAQTTEKNLPPGYPYTVEVAADGSRCPLHCSSQYEPVCVVRNPDDTRTYKLWTFLNQCLATVFMCQHPVAMSLKPEFPNTANSVYVAPIVSASCAELTFENTFSFFETSMSMQHYGYLDNRELPVWHIPAET